MTDHAAERESTTDVARDEPAPTGSAIGAAPVDGDATGTDAAVTDAAVTDAKATGAAVTDDPTAQGAAAAQVPDVDPAPPDAAAPVVAPGEVGDAEAVHARFVVVEVVDVSFELPSPSPIVHLLEESAPFRSLYFPVGLPEAQSIALAIAGEQAPRPTTHDLLVSVLGAAGCDVVAVRITGERGGTILAELDLMGPRGHEVVDCRPTDGIAIALRLTVPAPILCEAGLLDR